MKATKQQKLYILRYLLMQVEEPNSPYAKKPIYGHTGLYFAHPGYQHSDYNKWRACDIEGNEEFCETIIELWDKLTKLL